MLLRIVAVCLLIIAAAFFAELVMGVHLGIVRLVRHDAALFAHSLSPW